ncbi:MAG: hypothetical protein IKD13_07400, partial [Firmicutes bacterium]|nr:hypothetical protein [Bacillota bacterium]
MMKSKQHGTRLLALALLISAAFSGCGSSGSEGGDGQWPDATQIVLSDEGITVNGTAIESAASSETSAVFTSHDIIYYEDRDTYDSGNAYGEGTDADKHSAEDAAAHTVVHITEPGT